MRTPNFRAIQKISFWMGLPTGIMTGIAVSIVSLQTGHQWDFVPHESQYTLIEEHVSPDGSKKAIIFAEKDDGLDEMRHVKILTKVEKFDPNIILSTRTKFPWHDNPAFDFSILRPVKLLLAWDDSKTLRITYPVDSREVITYQRLRSSNAEVDIVLTAEYAIDKRTNE